MITVVVSSKVDFVALDEGVCGGYLCGYFKQLSYVSVCSKIYETLARNEMLLLSRRITASLDILEILFGV
jgi:hypothetical protein